VSDFYRLESDPSMYINLDSDTEFLREQQARLHRLSALVMRDIQVLTETIVERNGIIGAER